ncbi:MAG: aminotransferase class V-fold PLP-dependent enzyme [Anaerolineae bacterium]|jgi:selenocysteine lyase/cysteine desulfurase
MRQSEALDVEAARELFPVADCCAYLDHAATAPLSTPVRDAMEAYLSDRATGGEAGKSESVSDELRRALAKLVNAAPQEIAFAQNTSAGLNVVANGLPLEPGDNVVFCDMEFPSNVYPWMNLQRRGIEARCIPHVGGGLTVEALETHADEHTRVVAVSSVEFLTGFRNDLMTLGEWCDGRDTYFVVDAIQSLGVLPMDVRACRVDFLCCGGPKWLMGPAGQGFIYCRQEVLDDLRPPFAGCRSVIGRDDWRSYDLAFLPDASRFELGCPNFVGQVGLLAAVRLLLSIGIDSIAEWALTLADALIADLERRGYEVASDLRPERRSPIVSFKVPGDVGDAHEELASARVVVSKREQYIRVSPHCYNTEQEVLRVGETLGDVRRRQS